MTGQVARRHGVDTSRVAPSESERSEGGKFLLLLDLAPRAAAYAAVDYTDPT